MNERAIYQKAIEHWGKVPQIQVAIEEMSELIKELCKALRRKENIESIAEEIADVHIMLEQLTLIFNNAKEIKAYKQQKLKRLNERLETLMNNGGIEDVDHI